MRITSESDGSPAVPRWAGRPLVSPVPNERIKGTLISMTARADEADEFVQPRVGEDFDYSTLDWNEILKDSIPLPQVPESD